MKIFFLILISLQCPLVFAQDFYPGNNSANSFSIIPGINYVSSATIQLSPFSSDLVERNLTTELFGGYGYGITIKKKLFREDISFGITAEYLKIEDNSLTQTIGEDAERVRLRVTEQIWLYPVEFTGYFNLPSFVDDLNIYLGGGVGVYFGDRKRSILNISTETNSVTPGINFLILSGVEYFLTDKISGIFEFRFREGEFVANSSFPVSEITVNNRNYPIEQNLNSRIFVDGLKLTFGIGYHF
jgi:hypothetical protein